MDFIPLSNNLRANIVNILRSKELTYGKVQFHSKGAIEGPKCYRSKVLNCVPWIAGLRNFQGHNSWYQQICCGNLQMFCRVQKL